MKKVLADIPFYPDQRHSERCKLDVYVPESSTTFPTLVWFYGGGMMEGDKSFPHELADQGIAVVTPDYRLHPSTKAPGYIEDAAAAIAWTFANIDSFGGDPNRVYVGGCSAGGYLASMVILDKRWLKPYGLDPDQVKGLASISGQAITHFTIRSERGIPEHQAIIDDLAPFYHIRKEAPPICLVTGDRELEIMGRYEENAYFHRMLKLVGHEANELHELPGRDHGGVGGDGMPYMISFIQKLDADGAAVRT
jgi:acetyl esterase/lipase